MNNTDRLCLGCMNDNGGAAVCPICGYDRAAASDTSVIDAGAWMKERYLFGRVIEQNGEGITYIGWDNQNDNVVYIKEYFPQGLCTRLSNKAVKITEGKEYEFNHGIMQFLEISRKLSELDAPCIMPVVETLEIGCSAYSIIKCSAGIPLREFLLRNGGTLKWEQAKPLFMPLINTLEELANAGIYHGGISPETIIVGRDGKLHLMGVAIPELRDAGSEFTSQIYPGFAALEQYSAELPLGTYTDVYGVAATLFRALIGNPPMAANERAVHDNMSIPAKAAETIPPYVLTALANALQINPQNRTRTMAALRDDLSKSAAAVAPVPVAARTAADKPRSSASTKNKNRKYAIIAAAITAGALLLVAAIVGLLMSGGGDGDSTQSSSIVIPSEPSSTVQNGSSVPTVIENLYPVPKLIGLDYAEILKNEEWERNFKIVISGAEFSNTVPSGHVVSQSIAQATEVKKSTVIEVVVSLGNSEIMIPDVSRMSKADAYVKLLEAGVAKDKIIFVDRYDEVADPQLVISTNPAAKSSISRFAEVEVYFNTREIPDDYTEFEGTGVN